MVTSIRIHKDGVVLLDQGPVLDLVCAWFTGDDDMFAVLGGGFDGVGICRAGRKIGILTIQGDTGFGGPVQRRRLLDGVITQADGDHLAAVGTADIEGTGLHVLSPEDFLLQVNDGVESGDEGIQHLDGGVLSLPTVRAAASRFCQVRHVQCGEVLRVGGALDVLIGRLFNQVEHGPADVGEVGDQAVVHDGVAAKHERMVVDGGDRRARGGADVREQRRRRRVAADAVEVGVVVGRLAVLVHGRPCACDRFDKVASCRRVPHHPEPVDVEEPVAQRYLLRRRLLAWRVGEELGQVVVVHLFR